MPHDVGIRQLYGCFGHQRRCLSAKKKKEKKRKERMDRSAASGTRSHEVDVPVFNSEFRSMVDGFEDLFLT